MKIIHSITVTAVVLMFTLSVFAVPAAAAHDPKDPEHDTLFPDANFDGGVNENFPDSVFDERVGHLIGPNRLDPPDERTFPGADWDERNFPGADWDEKNSPGADWDEKTFPGSDWDERTFPDSIFDDDGDQVEEGPEIQG